MYRSLSRLLALYTGVFILGSTAPDPLSAARAVPVVQGDTIRYRVCKDLSVCFLEFEAPSASLAPGESMGPTPILSLQSAPTEVFDAFVEEPASGWNPWLVGIPLAGLAGAGYWVLQDDGGEGGDRPDTPEPPTPPIGVVPEPASMLLFATGVAAVAAARARRRQ